MCSLATEGTGVGGLIKARKYGDELVVELAVR